MSAIPVALLTLAFLATPAEGTPTLGGCQMFPASTDANRGTLADLNRDISQAPVHPNTAGYIAAIDALGSNHFLRANFGSNPGYGIPFKVVPATQPAVRVRFTAYPDESDPGPYPIPKNASVEQASDRHVLVMRQGECRL